MTQSEHVDERGASRTMIAAGSVALAILALDVLTKGAATMLVGPEAAAHERWLVTHTVGLSYAENDGIAFGLMRGRSPLALTIAAILAILVVGGVAWRQRHHRRIVLATAIIAGGAAGNLVDRVRFSHVRDFFAVGPWPPFNVADASITVGALAIAIGLFNTGQRDAESVESRRLPPRNATTVMDAPE